MHRFCLILGLLFGIEAASPLAAIELAGQQPASVELPARFSEHRIHVCPVTEAGDTLCFYTDTGGGVNMLYRHTAERLGMVLDSVVWAGDTTTVTEWPRWAPKAGIPVPGDTSSPLGSRLMIVPMSDQVRRLAEEGDAGFLGRLWFANRIWTIDYPSGRMWVHTAAPALSSNARVVPLGFLTDDFGTRTTHFPSIRVVVDGDSLDLLFDTGATMTLTDSAAAVLDDGRPARRASSFISAAVFDRWRAEHPDWRVIENGTTTVAESHLIRVPEIEIAGYAVGRVWFERRPTGTFEDWMSEMMDRDIVGALGGNAMRFFLVTVDYPNARAVFSRPVE